MSEPIVYVDNNATTRVADEARQAMLPFLGELYGNPSSVYTFGGRVKSFLDRSRTQVAALLGADPTEILFTSCGTESDNLAIFGALEAFPKKRHLITSAVEHMAVKNPAATLEKRGYDVTWLGVDEEGRLSLDELRAAIRDDTALVSLMWANNETGVLFPVEEAARIVKERGVVFHVDAVQAAGKIPINLQKVPIDLLSMSAHKIHAPKGVGALYIRRGARIRPQMLGGHQERSRRGGTENVPGIVAFGVAAELAAAHIDEENTRVKSMRDRLEEGLLQSIPESRINGDRANRLPNTCNLSFRYVQGEAILLTLDEDGICASTGSACTTGQVEPSHVLRAMNVPFTFLQGSIRFSLSRYNTESEIDRILDVAPRVVSRLRALSPMSPPMAAPQT